MKNWSFSYAVVKQIVRSAFWLSHKKITIIGLSRIPKNKPIIFAPNHQNALMDPLAILCTNYTQPVWLARADIFKLKATRPILRFLKIMPVYRIRDGKENLGENEKIFSLAIEVLEHKKQLALFPEAAHSGRRQMLAHKKAIPRIAFLAEEKNDFNLDLQIVPVGIYYSHYWHFNRELILHYGEPIPVKKYQEDYLLNSHQATMALRNEIAKQVEKLTINIKSKAHYDNYELIRELIGPAFARNNKQFRSHTKNRFFNDQKLIQKLEAKEHQQTDLFHQLHHKLDQLRQSLNEIKIEVQELDKKKIKPLALLGKSMFSILLLPVILIGFLLHVFPFILPRHYAQKKIKDPTFYSTFQFVVGLVTYFLLCVILSLISLFYISNLVWIILLLVTFLLLGKLSYIALCYIQDLISNYRLFIYKRQHKSEFENLFQTKNELKQQLLDLAQS